jgi:hypothetical protein
MLRKSWWCWLANEEKRHPRAATSPPMTPVSLVDLRLQTPIVSGEMNRETPADREHSQTGREK